MIAATAPRPEDNRLWVRKTTSDGACSAEFPQPAKHEKKLVAGVETDSVSAYLESVDKAFRMSFVETPPDAAALTDEQRLDAVRDAIAQRDFQVVDEKRFTTEGMAGRELEMRHGRFTMRAKLFISGKRNYRMIVTTSDAHDADAARFLGSIRCKA